MNASDACFDRIKGYEGYGKALPNGDCTAYQEKINGKLDIPTIGWGCTEGVEMGMVWTREQAEAALRREIAKHEAIVSRVVTVDLNQNEYDALVSFNHNVGKLGNSTLLKKLNKGDRAGAAKEFLVWDKFGGKSSPGLASRRASEMGLFLRPVETTTATMPQAADKPPLLSTADKIKLAVGAAGAGGGMTVSHSVPQVPDAVSQGLASAQAWQGIGSQVSDLVGWVIAKPLISLPLVAVVVVLGWIAPKWAEKQGGANA